MTSDQFRCQDWAIAGYSSPGAVGKVFNGDLSGIGVRGFVDLLQRRDHGLAAQRSMLLTFKPH